MQSVNPKRLSLYLWNSVYKHVPVRYHEIVYLFNHLNYNNTSRPIADNYIRQFLLDRASVDWRCTNSSRALNILVQLI